MILASANLGHTSSDMLYNRSEKELDDDLEL